MNVGQLANFASAVADFVAQGMNLASDEERARRYTICQGCERFSKDEYLGHGKCLECGCNMAVKTAMPSQACPLGKWNAAPG